MVKDLKGIRQIIQVGLLLSLSFGSTSFIQANYIKMAVETMDYTVPTALPEYSKIKLELKDDMTGFEILSYLESKYYMKTVNLVKPEDLKLSFKIPDAGKYFTIDGILNRILYYGSNGDAIVWFVKDHNLYLDYAVHSKLNFPESWNPNKLQKYMKDKFTNSKFNIIQNSMYVVTNRYDVTDIENVFNKYKKDVFNKQTTVNVKIFKYDTKNNGIFLIKRNRYVENQENLLLHKQILLEHNSQITLPLGEIGKDSTGQVISFKYNLQTDSIEMLKNPMLSQKEFIQLKLSDFTGAAIVANKDNIMINDSIIDDVNDMKDTTKTWFNKIENVFSKEKIVNGNSYLIIFEQPHNMLDNI